jgi:histidinol-phosphate aminotransferase
MSSRKKRVISEVLSEAQRLSSYDVGVTIEGLARRLGISPSRVLKLNSNENFFVPLDFLRSILRKAAEEIDPRIYPRDEIRELKEAFGGYVDVDPGQVVIGTGSDQLIDILCRMVLRRGDEAVAISPTFSIYRRCTEIQGAVYRPIPLREDFSLDAEAMLDAATRRTRLMFLCSPNNPTANRFSPEDIKRLAERFDGVVAVDEAYADFSDGSVVNLTEEFENLVVFRTLSKVFGLAGLRIGFAVANPGFARVMDEKFQMPYSVSLLAVKAALMILGQLEAIREAIRRIRIERERLIRELNGIGGVEAFPSETNFVLFQVNMSSDIIYERLLERGIIIRNIGRVVNRENCLRVTVAPPPLMDRFLESLKEVVA